LVQDPASEFSSMVDETGAANATYLRKVLWGIEYSVWCMLRIQCKVPV
jgi:hypothetical protein